MRNLLIALRIRNNRPPMVVSEPTPFLFKTMQANFACLAFALIAISGPAVAAEKPRIFITESAAVQVAGNAAVADVKGSLSVTGGTSPQNVDVIKAFAQRCPAVVVTASREKADYLVRLDHEAINPTTPFVHGNKVAVFDRNEDLIYSQSSRILSSAVKGACKAITAHSHQ